MSFTVHLNLDRQIRTAAPVTVELTLDRVINGTATPVELLLDRVIREQTHGHGRTFSRRRAIVI